MQHLNNCYDSDLIMDSLVIISFQLCVLGTAINQVTCDLQVSGTQDRFILEENVPFVLACFASHSDNKDISGNFTWRYESHITGSVAVKDDHNNEIVTTSGNGKKLLTSTLTVLNPPNVPNVVFYYYAKCTTPGESDEESFPVILFKETTIPTPKVSNGTYFAVATETTVKFGDKVTLKCQISYDNTNHNTEKNFKIALSWRKRNDPYSDIVRTILKYKYGTNTEELKHHITAKNSSDGGEYFCQAVLYTASEKNQKQNVVRAANITVRISPFINGAFEKEVKEVAGKDVELHCDIIGYPIVYEWLDENRKLISGKHDSRIQINDNVLSIDDIDYSDSKKYVCVGKMGDVQLEQIIILRVKATSGRGCTSTQAHIIGIACFIGGLFCGIIVVCVILLIRCWLKKEETVQVPKAASSSLNYENVEDMNAPVYQELDLTKMDGGENCQSLEMKTRSSRDKEVPKENEVGYAGLKKVRGKDDHDYEALKRV